MGKSMRINELIDRLRVIEVEYGDLEVSIVDNKHSGFNIGGIIVATEKAESPVGVNVETVFIFGSNVSKHMREHFGDGEGN